MADKYPSRSLRNVQRAGSERIAVARPLQATASKCKRALDSAQIGCQCEPVVKQRKLVQGDVSAAAKRADKLGFDSALTACRSATGEPHRLKQSYQRQGGDDMKGCLLSESQMRILCGYTVKCHGDSYRIGNIIHNALARMESGTVSHVQLDNGSLRELVRSFLKNVNVLSQAALRFTISSSSKSMTVFSTSVRHAVAKDGCVGADFNSQLARAITSPNAELVSAIIECHKCNKRSFKLLKKALDQKDPQEVLKNVKELKTSVGTLLNLMQSPSTFNLNIADCATEQVNSLPSHQIRRENLGLLGQMEDPSLPRSV